MENANGAGASNQNGDINALVDEKITNDADFQTEIELLSDEDKAQALADKKAELIAKEYSDLALKAKKDAELANNYKIRAEKAEKSIKPAEVPPTPPSMSTKDVMALINAKVTEDEDIAEVEEYARFKGISVSEALKSSVVKGVLAEKAEHRKTAEAANTNTASKRGVSKNTDEVIEKKFTEGKELTDEEIREQARIRREKLLNKNKR